MRASPTFLKTAVVYQIFLRAYTPEGTIAAAERHLPELKQLGVDIVYLCPFVRHDDGQDQKNFSQRMIDCGLPGPRNPYRLSDYFEIDPEYGTDHDFARFVQTAHELGLKVMLDLVYMHCGMNATFLARHPDYVRRNQDGSIKLTSFGFPLVNADNPGMREYLYENMVYFVRRFDIDGYRCDCGDCVPPDLWEEGARRVRCIRPDFIMLNEGEKQAALDSAFDLNYGGLWVRKIQAYMRGERPAEQVRECIAVNSGASQANTGCYILAVENHDFANDAYDHRIETQVTENDMEGALMTCAFLPGVPFLYGGQEIADACRHSIMGNRYNAPTLHVDWTRAKDKKARRRRKFLTEVYRLRHTLPALSDRTVPCEWLEGGNAIAFLRRCGGQTLAVAYNASGEDVRVPLPTAGKGQVVLSSEGAAFDGAALTLAPHSYIAVTIEG